MKRLFTLMLTSLAVMQAMAYDFKSGDLYYNITSDEEPYTVEVTYEDNADLYANNYTGLTSAEIPEIVTYEGETYSVTSISRSAFYGCSGLTSVTIPNSVTSIGSYAFDCDSLTRVDYQGSIENWLKIWFGSEDANPLCYAHHLYINNEEVTNVVVPETITEIEEFAFFGCSGLTSVVIPNSVTSIGRHAFEGCSGLTSVAIPNSVTSIGWNAFEGCSSLTSVAIPNSVTSIYDYAFYNCSSLTSVTIPNSVTSIYNYAFEGCIGLKKVDYKGTIEDWLNISFGDLYANPLYFAHHLYINNEEVTSVVIPETITKIKDFAFRGCTDLTSVTIPNSVTSIGNGAFNGCSGLTSVTIGNSVTSIGDNAFAHCNGLTSVTIPNSVTSIGWNAFEGCSGLTSVSIPNSVTSIGRLTFSGCSSLTSVAIPNSVTSIDANAFYGVPNINYNGTATGSPWGAYALNGTIDDNFVYTDAEKTVLARYVGKGTSVTIPNSVTSIGSNAFSNCSGLISVTIPNSVTSIGKGAFEYCRSLTRVDYQGTIEDWLNISFSNSAANPLRYAHHLYINNEEVTSVVIPKTINEIKNYVFFGCSGLTLVTIPNSVTSIGSNAFNGCSGLTSVTIPNSVKSIEVYAFYNCENLTIYCEAESKPSGWNYDWNPDNRPVVWGYSGISDDIASNVKIYAHSNTIVVENATEEISVYDAVGRLICKNAERNNRAELQVKQTGIYIVKVGGVAQRVFVK